MRSVRITRSSSLLLCALWLVTSPVTAQSGTSLFFDSVDVNVVNIEVIVTGKNGEPVTGLTREDFEVYEDGERIELSNFFAVEKRQAVIEFGDETGEDEVAEPPPVEPETKQLNLVIFVDNLNMDPRNRNMIFHHLRQTLDELDPRDRVMLAVLRDQVEIEQEFTNDKTLLLAALGRMERDLGRFALYKSQLIRFMNDLQAVNLTDEDEDIGGPESKLIDYNLTINNAERLSQNAIQLAEERYRLARATINALGQFTDTLTGFEGRKAVLYVSDGLHVRPADSLAAAWRSKFEGWLARNSGADVREAERAGRSLEQLKLDTTRDFQRLVEYASGNKVSFYPLSNLGTMSGSHLSPQIRGSSAVDGSGPISGEFTALDAMSRESSLLHMADGTGGVAFTRTTNIRGLLDVMNRDFETFYSLGFTSSSPANDNQFHKVNVKVRKPGVKVRHFRGHMAKDPLDNLQALTLSALYYAKADNPLAVSFVEAGEQVQVKPQRYTVPFMVKVPFSKLLLLPEEEFHRGQLSLYVVARDELSGQVSKPYHIELPLEVPNDRVFDAITEAVGYPLTLELAKGPKRIAIGARDKLARLDATLLFEINVGENVAEEVASN